MESYTVTLSNKTAVEKQKNERFEEYLKNTKTEYETKNVNDSLKIHIYTSNIASIKNAIDTYITCTGNSNRIAYAN